MSLNATDDSDSLIDGEIADNIKPQNRYNCANV